MPWWVTVVIALSAVCSGVPCLYARKITSKHDEGDGKPVWFGGVANFYLVTSVLRKRSRQGDKWAGRAHFAYCIGVAIIPVLIVSLAIHDYWMR